MRELQAAIEDAFERRASITPRTVEAKLKDAVEQVIGLLDEGRLRVAEKVEGRWVTHEWVKKAVLLSFRIDDNQCAEGGHTSYFDKVPSKFADYSSRDFRAGGFRVVPPAMVRRRGAFIARNVVLMPSFVNIGAYVDEGTMVDTWATVGSCAQIGKNVHLSGGVGIGGVLEPLQANPTIIEDDCFIGARSEVVEGVIVGGRGRDLDGRLHRSEHEDLPPRNRRSHLRADPAGVCRRARQPARGGRQVQPVLRRHREAGGREDPRQDQHQRAAARHLVRLRRPRRAGCRASFVAWSLQSSPDSTPGHPNTASCTQQVPEILATRAPRSMFLTPLFKLMAEKQASDLFFTAGAPIQIKINGTVMPINAQVLDPTPR